MAYPKRLHTVKARTKRIGYAGIELKCYRDGHSNCERCSCYA